MITAFSDEQVRTLINIEPRYEVWIEAARALARMPYGMHRKTIGGRNYLYEMRDRSGNGQSLGPWTQEQERRLVEFRTAKADTRHRLRMSKAKLDESGAMARALRLPLLANAAGAILREADRRELLGTRLFVVGNTAIAAYAIEAAAIIHDAPVEVGRLDLAWVGADRDEGERTVLAMLKAVDPTYAINAERTFAAWDAKGHQVRLRIVSSRSSPLVETEWLLRGRPVSRVTVCRDRTAARIVAPDPRWFVLNLLRSADTSACSSHSTDVENQQLSLLLLDVIDEAMPHYPLDDAFVAQLPNALARYLMSRRVARPRSPSLAW